MKIYDCFPLFNELDLLHIRLELLYNHVDYFIISECDSTFSGLDKPFNFELNKDRYGKYLDKIIYLKNYNTKDINNYINTYSGEKQIIFDNILKFYNDAKCSSLTDYGKPHWCRDFIHKEFLALAMNICKDEDIIIFGDLDEIPNPNKFKFDENTYVLYQKNMTYNINKEVINVDPWKGGIILPYYKVKNNSMQKLRNDRHTYIPIVDAGWHLTHMGGTARIIEKIKSWSHQEFNNSSIINNVENNAANNRDIFRRRYSIKNININDYYPESIINFIKQNYSYLIG